MATIPAISNTDRILDASPGVLTSAYTITWPVIGDTEALAKDDLVVLVDGAQLLTSEFEFSGTAIAGISGVWNGGTLTLDVAVSGVRVIIYSARAPRRTSGFLEGRPLPMTTLDAALDDMTIMMRDLHLAQKRSLKFPVTDVIDEADPEISEEAADRVGMFLGFDAAGNPAVLSGSGADAAMRTDLASPTLSNGDALIAVKSTATGSVATTLHELNERGRLSCYHFMTPAQIADVKGRTLLVDVTTPLQTWINYCASNRIPGELELGRYSTSASLGCPNDLDICGQGKGSGATQAPSDIVPVNNTFPAFINAVAQAADCRNVVLERFRVTGGNRCFNLTTTGTIQGWRLTDIWLEGATTAGFEADEMLIANHFTRVIFSKTVKGFKVAGANTNLNTFLDCEFIELNGTSIEIQFGEDNHFINNRIEARDGAAIGSATCVVLNGTKATKFSGGYVEDTFTNFITETNSTNTTVLDSMRFSNAATFTSDGILGYGNNQLNVASDASARAYIVSPNSGLKLENSAVYHHFDDARIAVGTKKVLITTSGVAENLFTFSRGNTNNADNQQSMAGTLIVTVAGKQSGGTKSYMATRVPILITGYANTLMVSVLGTGIETADNAVGATLTVAAVAGATETDLTIAATFTLATLGASYIHAYLDVVLDKNPAYAHMTVLAVAA